MTTFFISTARGRKMPVMATKYNIAPRSASFAATFDGVKCEAWTTEGKGKSEAVNRYIYFRNAEGLYYFKVDSADEQLAARQQLAIESEEFADKFADAMKEPKAPARKRVPANRKTKA